MLFGFLNSQVLVLFAVHNWHLQINNKESLEMYMRLSIIDYNFIRN